MSHRFIIFKPLSHFNFVIVCPNVYRDEWYYFSAPEEETEAQKGLESCQDTWYSEQWVKLEYNS